MGWDCSLMGLRVDTVYPLLAIKQVYSSLVVARTDHGKGQLRMYPRGATDIRSYTARC